tara:strand:- start:788 stop:1510 length:723 start_codon:yes stop_codon:yes gene_type:complete
MGVNINSVYQKVLALLNKEQRGYLTPQEFNLLADRAQNEIYEAYFHKARNSNAKIKDDDQYTDTLEMIEAKLAPFFKQENNTTIASNILTLPTDLYKIINISTTLGVVTEVNRREYAWIFGGDALSNKLKPLTHTPVYYRSSGTQITIVTASDGVISDGAVVSVSYYKKPKPPNWTYVVLQEKALYNSAATDAQDFELLESEEEPLVSKILMLSGVITKQQDIGQVGANAIQMTNQEQNS